MIYDISKLDYCLRWIYRHTYAQQTMLVVKSLLRLKIYQTIFIFSKKILGIQSKNARRTQILLTSFLLCFGGGVLLATAMLHILPESSEGLALAGAKLEIEFLPYLVLCSGFFLIYLVEELVDLFLGHSHHSEDLHRNVSIRGSRNEKCADSQASAHVDVAQSKSQRVGALRDFFTSKYLKDFNPNSL